MNVSSIQSSCGTSAASGTREARGPRQMPDEVVGALADKLGMSKDDLKSKLESSDDPRKALDQLAEEKGISRAELRETIHAAMPKHGGEAGPPPPPPDGGSKDISFDDEAGQKLLSALADTMGMSKDDLKSDLESGADLREILAEHNVSHEDVRAAFQEAFKSWQSYGANGSADTSAQPQYNAVDASV